MGTSQKKFIITQGIMEKEATENLELMNNKYSEMMDKMEKKQYSKVIGIYNYMLKLHRSVLAFTKNEEKKTQADEILREASKIRIIAEKTREARENESTNTVEA